MHTTPNSLSSSRASHFSNLESYAIDLTNANLFQTDFASVERRQCLVSLQSRLFVLGLFAGHVRHRFALYREMTRTFRQHGLLHGMRPVFAILKRDAMEALQ